MLKETKGLEGLPDLLKSTVFRILTENKYEFQVYQIYQKRNWPQSHTPVNSPIFNRFYKWGVKVSLSNKT